MTTGLRRFVRGGRQQLLRPMPTNGELSAANVFQISAFSREKRKKKKKSLNNFSIKSLKVFYLQLPDEQNGAVHAVSYGSSKQEPR